MANKTIGILTALLTFITSVSADPLRLPDSSRSGTITTEAVELVSGHRLWTERQTMFTGVEHGKNFLLATIKGRGRFGGANSWEITSYYYLEPQIRPYYAKKLYFSERGELLKTDTFYYDQKARKIYFKSEQGKSGKITTKTLDMVDDLVDYYVLIPAVVGLDFSKSRVFKFNFISSDPKIYSFTVRLVGIEKVKTAEKTFECNKLELTPELGAFGLLEGFIPKSIIWVSRGDVREFVRYEGLESGLGTPYIRLQLLKEPIKTK